MPTANYQTDMGYIYYGVALLVSINNASNSNYDIEQYIPNVYKNAYINTDAICGLGREILPRTLKALLNEQDYILMQFPFMGGTPEYIQFIQEIEGNTLIKAYEILSETIKDSKVRLLINK